MPNCITIREDHFTDQLFHLTISFDNGPEYEVKLPNPVDKDREQRFEWYFEQHIRAPFLNGERVKKVVEEIRQYGETLFTALFQATDVFSDYRTFRNGGLSQLEFAIAGKSTGFHSIHWEALKDPQLPEAFAAGQANVFRKNNRPAGFSAQVEPSPVLNLLIVTARPDWEDDVNYRTIIRPIIDLIESSQLRVDPHILRPGTYRRLVEHLDEKPAGFYHLIHFDTHGALLEYNHLQQGVNRNRYQMQANWGLPDLAPFDGKKAFLLFEGEEKGQAVPVSAEELAKRLTARNVPVCLLNACQSAKEADGPYQTSLAAKLMESGVQAVLGQSYSITVSAARLLMQRLYETLFSQANLNGAVASGRRELAMDKNRRAYFNQTIDLEDWLLPVFYQNNSVRFPIRAFTPDEEEQHYQRRDATYQPSAEPTYGFIGRDLDILTIEKRLLKHNMLLVRGMGGTGKTTLLEYLARWWERTGWVQKSFYFGYDKRAYTLEQILNEIARQLFNKWEYAQFQASNPVTQRSKIEDRLKTGAYCLILDNCESITGTSLAIPNTLRDDEQTDLRDFLKRLRKQAGRPVKSFVLFGSRSDEVWLAPVTFDKNVYSLPGLDEEARTDLARKILERADVAQAAKDPDFKELMNMMAGYPLVMEVILANLRTKTAAQIIADLRAGNVDLDRKDGTDKTNSLLRCVDYSHSNLSPDAQKLLLCLAPFSGYIYQNGLEDYFNEVKQQPFFQHYSFERWPEVIDEAVKWGLMEPIAEGSPMLSLQPVFPYFLQQKLSKGVDAAGKQELEMAFRNYYDRMAAEIRQLLASKQPEEKQLGVLLAQLEYKNIDTALQTSLQNHLSIDSTYFCLSEYIDTLHNEPLGLTVAQSVLSRLDSYPEDVLAGLISAELVGVLDNAGRRFYLTKNYQKAKEVYLKALTIWQSSQAFPPENIERRSASIYHQLGMVAGKEREWAQAKAYYQNALDIYIAFNDRYEQAGTYHQLGNVAVEEREWAQAKAYYQNALDIYIAFNDRYSQAGTYHQLGMVAGKEREWAQAKAYYQNALDIKIAFNDRYEQAGTYHQLGNVAVEEREWAQAKAYYQNALDIYIAFNDRYSQAGTYHQLGMVAEEEREWAQAKAYYQNALAIFIEFKDEYSQQIVRNSLTRIEDNDQNDQPL